MNEQELTERAKANVGFYRHLLMYFLINAGLFMLDYYDNAQFDWAYFAFFGWGIGLLSHFLQIKSFSLFSVEKEKERLRNKQR
ncbi:MAG: 2TM domain-containing protein [Flavobacteriaceae bacterium]|nr:2TM domain-containing protein [Flavobacteriaceae bacterium]